MTPKISGLGAYIQEYQHSIENPEMFWSNIADTFYWQKRWDNVVSWDFEKPEIKWFENAKLNITENIFERHLFMRKDQPAIIWESNNPDEEPKSLSYGKLFSKVNKFANALDSLGVQKGDRIAIYMPMIPELAIAMLACARIGAIHSIVFGGFSAQALSDRINDAKAKILITADGAYRGNKTIPLKEIGDEALQNCSSIEKCIVVKRTESLVEMNAERDIWWEDLMENSSAYRKATVVDSEDPLFILYTSGSTGKPKGIVHTTAGYMVYSAYTFNNVFQYRDGDVYFCTADIGWITGHSYIIYGPLLTGATTLMFEGIPTYPTPSRFWQIVEKFKVNQFYTAPTAIRSLMTHGETPFEGIDLSSLKVLGSVGEPINEEAWHWYHTHVGKNKCPIVDTWWQTETGGIAISPLAGITPTKPSYATLPLPGIKPVVLDSDGKELYGNSVEGNLCLKYPWPGMLRTIYNDHQKFKDTYFSAFKGYYFTGDGVKRDEDGYYRLLGRVDDVINVSGHRMGTAEVENAINEHPQVNESAVVGFPHEIKGQGIYAFVVCNTNGKVEEEGIKKSILAGVSKIIGPIAKPDKIQIVSGLPKTRSGKIMRRILRKVAEGDPSNLGDISTLIDPLIVQEIIDGAE